MWHVEGRPLKNRPGTQEPFEGVSPEEQSESVPGTSTDYFCPLAAELGVYITVPICEKVAREGVHVLYMSLSFSLSLALFLSRCLLVLRLNISLRLTFVFSSTFCCFFFSCTSFVFFLLSL